MSSLFDLNKEIKRDGSFSARWRKDSGKKARTFESKTPWLLTLESLPEDDLEEARRKEEKPKLS